MLEKFHAEQRELILSQGRLKLGPDESTVVRRRPLAWARKVVVIGVDGPSGSGKTSLARWLHSVLGSPYDAISTDSFVRLSDDIPTCPHVASEKCKQWNNAKCFELPAAYDLNLLVDELLAMKSLIACARVLPTIWLKLPGSYRKMKPRRELPAHAPCYVVVEGFVLFIEPQVTQLCSHLLRLHVPPEESCRRRFHREGKMAQQWQAFQEHYFHHVHATRQSLQALADRNVADRVVWHVDATADCGLVRTSVLRLLYDAELDNGNFLPYSPALAQCRS